MTAPIKIKRIGVLISLVLFVSLLHGCTSQPEHSSDDSLLSAITKPVDTPTAREAYIVATRFVEDEYKSRSGVHIPIEPLESAWEDDGYYFSSTVEPLAPEGAAKRQGFMIVVKHKGGEWQQRSNWDVNFLQIGDRTIVESKKQHQ